jgi:hypothetical protein
MTNGRNINNFKKNLKARMGNIVIMVQNQHIFVHEKKRFESVKKNIWLNILEKDI